MNKLYIIQYGPYGSYFVTTSAKSEEDAIEQLTESINWHGYDHLHKVLIKEVENVFNTYEVERNMEIKKL